MSRLASGNYAFASLSEAWAEVASYFDVGTGEGPEMCDLDPLQEAAINVLAAAGIVEVCESDFAGVTGVPAVASLPGSDPSDRAARLRKNLK